MEAPSTLIVGTRLTLTIEDMAFGGEGVGRVGEFVVFVPFVAVGETVEAEVIEVKKRFARAKLLQVTQTSPQRVTPQCQYFAACGGCQYQHLDYSAQLALKHKQIVDLFQRVGAFENAPIDPVFPCPQPYGYRNRIMIRSQWNKPEQKLNIGFIRADCGLVEDIQECKIAEPALNEQIQHVRKNPPPKGGIKVVLRIAPEGWEVPRDSFFQNNFFLLPKLVDLLRERIKDAGTKHLIDAYCGVGFFSLELANVVERFTGIELDALAIKAARRNAVTRNVTNGDFISGSTEQFLPQVLQQADPAKTTIILDPPRVGCQPQTLELLRMLKPAQLIYVSCHPATLARDLKILCDNGTFKLQKVMPLDMFPQTQHVECISDLRAGS
jgi:tRNA/tmRNA/rRNA uracil-C5-methylase (TrmA/RlmC/RlmD family)